MKFLLSAKGKDITAWRAVDEFTLRYRRALLEAAIAPHRNEADDPFTRSRSSLDDALATHRDVVQTLAILASRVAEAGSAAEIKELTTVFYNELYRHFALFRSAPVFYQLSTPFLGAVGEALVTLTKNQLGLFSRHLPELALIAIGPAGRGEYSPFCPLQLFLIHEDAPPEQAQTITLFCHTLHDELEAAGFAMDSQITPRNPEWCASRTEWQQRCTDALHPHASEELINICRLIDQYHLGGSSRLAAELKEFSSTTLCTNRPALTNLIERMTSLTNGLGIMGGLKVERSGAERGLFKLLDHGLLPFTAALSALALIKRSTVFSSYDRILDLVQRRELDVEWAERMLDTWHNLHNVRLQQEVANHPTAQTGTPLCVNPAELSAAQRLALKETLESVAQIQRHVEIIFSGTGE